MGLVCTQVTKTFTLRSNTITALKDLSFQSGSSEFISIVGPSGCGKTTLLRILAGLVPLTSGSFVFDPPSQNGEPHAALVFQEQGLFPWMTVLDNVAFGLEMRRVPRNERHEKAMDLIGRVGLADFADLYPSELSRGMRQRVAVVRAFLMSPSILLMDEPFGALDAQTRLVLQSELLSLREAHQQMVLYVTHDIEEAILMGDRILVMSGQPGRILTDIPIPIPRPRNLEAATDSFVTDLKWQVWQMLKDEVRSELRLQPNKS